MLEQSTSFSKNGHDVHCPCGPVAGHEAGQVRVTVSHLDREGQVADVLEKTEKERDIVVFEILFPQNERGHIEPSDERAWRDGSDLKESENDPCVQGGLLPGEFRMQPDVDQSDCD